VLPDYWGVPPNFFFKTHITNVPFGFEIRAQNLFRLTRPCPKQHNLLSPELHIKKKKMTGSGEPKKVLDTDLKKNKKIVREHEYISLGTLFLLELTFEHELDIFPDLCTLSEIALEGKF
jgi:hypothetical protein